MMNTIHYLLICNYNYTNTTFQKFHQIFTVFTNSYHMLDHTLLFNFTLPKLDQMYSDIIKSYHMRENYCFSA